MTITMTFKVSELADTLSKNKENHTKIYNKALEDYRKATKKEHLETIKRTKKSMKREQERHEKVLSEEQERHKNTMTACEKSPKDLGDDITRVENAKNPKLHTIAAKPEHRKEEYVNVISMLKMTTDSEIELDNDQFSCYVQDKWIWQKQFLTNATQLYCSGSLIMTESFNDGGYYVGGAPEVSLSDSVSNNYMMNLFEENE